MDKECLGLPLLKLELRLTHDKECGNYLKYFDVAFGYEILIDLIL
jgi:hypothetical protein